MTVSDFSDREELERYSKQVINHEHVVYPAILKEMGNVRGKRVLDIGCANGDFAKYLQRFDVKYTGIDKSKAAIEHCRQRFGVDHYISYFVQDATKITDNYVDHFDYAVANMLMLNVDRKETLEKIFSETAGVLRRGGRFIFTDLHPFSKMMNTTTETVNHPEEFSYFRGGSEFSTSMLMKDGSRMKFDDVHWTLNDYIGAVKGAGLVLDNIIEPQPVKSPQLPAIYENYPVPEYILFSCIKPN